jgi:hypothetical protein
MDVIGGMAVVVGTSSTGGNTCEESPFVVSFPRGQNPRIDGPLGSCFPVAVKAPEGNALNACDAEPTWSEMAVDGQHWCQRSPGRYLRCRYVKGPGPSERAFGYASCRSLDYAEVAAEIDRLAGADKTLVPSNVHGSGSRCRCRPSFENCLSRLEAVRAEDQGESRREVWRKKAKAELRQWRLNGTRTTAGPTR